MHSAYDSSKGIAKPPKAPRQPQALIANEMHSPAIVSRFLCSTSIFVIGNEFTLFQSSNNASKRVIPLGATTRMEGSR